MRPSSEVHDALALLLSYPGEGRAERHDVAVSVIVAACPASRRALDDFQSKVAQLSPGEMEELYTRTFDNTDDRSLEVGWQLFGEQYSRGALMVRLRKLLRDHGVVEQTELPDHLVHVLPLLGRAPADVASVLAGSHVMQAVDKIITALEKKESPYVGVLQATRRVLTTHAARKKAQEVGV